MKLRNLFILIFILFYSCNNEDLKHNEEYVEVEWQINGQNLQKGTKSGEKKDVVGVIVYTKLEDGNLQKYAVTLMELGAGATLPKLKIKGSDQYVLKCLYIKNARYI